MSFSIYLDANATTHVLPCAVTAATQAMVEQFGNPSSSHSAGLVAKELMASARASAAQVVGAAAGDIVFTSGATEGIQTAVLSALCSIRRDLQADLRNGQTLRRPLLLVYGATEHKAVPVALAHWNQILGLGLELRALPVDACGKHDLQTLALWLPDTALLCTMAANNETGVVSDLAGIERLLTISGSQALWLVDCVQALGKLDLHLHSSRIDYAPFSGHKLYGPKGVGMLYVRQDAPYTALMAGGGQEGGMRGGTENLPGIAAFGAVLQALQHGNTFASPATLHAYRDQMELALCQAFPSIVFNAPLAQCLPTTLNFSVPDMTSKTLLDVFDAAGLCVSAGSACSAAKAMPSYVLEAMGLPAWQTRSAVRLSFGPLVDAQTIEAACQALARCGQALQGIAANDSDTKTGTTGAQAVSTQTVGTQAVDESVDASSLTLQWSELDAFMQAHPGARMVDVRESVEHYVSGGIRHHQWAALSAPLSALASRPPEWLTADAAAPVVLVCRSGNRSLKAARWLHARGYATVRHVHGGLALRPSE